MAYLDVDGSGKVEFEELAAAIKDYRRFKRAKRRLEVQQACAERRLFLDQHVRLLLQYLVLVSGQGARPAAHSPTAHTAAAAAPNTAALASTWGTPTKQRAELFVNALDVQRAVDKSGVTAISHYFREVRERHHADAYSAVKELRANGAA